MWPYGYGSLKGSAEGRARLGKGGGLLPIQPLMETERLVKPVFSWVQGRD